MNLKKITIIGIVFIFLFSFITHNIYDWFPSFFTSLLFPVNESIWEHQKMIFITVLIWGLIEYLLLKKNNISYSNIICSTVLSALFNIVIFLIIYTPIYIVYGHNMVVTLIIYFITIVASQLFGYIILKEKKTLKRSNIISVILIPLVFILFGFLTYYPVKISSVFYDSSSNKYGIYNYYDSSEK